MKSQQQKPNQPPEKSSRPYAPERKGASGERETRAYPLQIKAAGEDGVVEGYGSMFGVRDSYDDIIAPGAFEQTLAAHKAAGTMPAMLWQHGADRPIGIWTDMVEDEKGLKITGQLAMETVLGREAHALLKMRALNGLSIGFMSKQWTYDRSTDVRTITEIDLWEVSLVTFPANQAARVTNVKADHIAGLTTVRQMERALRDAGLSESAAKAFVAQAKRIAADERDAQEVARVLKAADRLLASFNPTSN